MRRATRACVVGLASLTILTAQLVRADDAVHVLELGYTPAPRAQVAIWIEDSAGTYLATVALTEAVAYRGLGNRPGASQMNSGYRWPYGRREGALPIWAHRRAAAPGAKLFPRVVFQDRVEGFASRTTADQSPDEYHCLQFDASHSTRDQLDAVSCASKFSSDKGRYMTSEEAQQGYSEPWDDGAGAASMRALPALSVYPPRMDVTRCSDKSCFDHADVDRYARDARDVMPEIDAVTRATAPGGMPQKLLFDVPSAWPNGEYVAYVEVNVEGDYNEHWSDAIYPTPEEPARAWDSFAITFGYPYRGQPSIVYAVPFTIGEGGARHFATGTPAGRSSWQHWSATYGQVEPLTTSIADPVGMSDTNGSGADRLQRDPAGERFTVDVKTVEAAGAQNAGVVVTGSGTPASGDSNLPGPVFALSLRTHPNKLRSHTWIMLRFQAAQSGQAIHAYDVRVSTEPITDEASFIRDGRPAKNATDAAEGATALMLPVATPEGAVIETAIGDLAADTHYFVGVRATDDSNRSGPISVAEIDTTARTFATVTPCFIATAAYGSPLASEIGALRRLRDRYLLAHAPGRALVAAYYALGPRAAASIADEPELRGLVRTLLSPLVAAARWLER